MIDRKTDVPGWRNPRAAHFSGWRSNLRKLHQLYGIKVGQAIARRHGGSLEEFPPILQLQTKSGCNASCAFCPQRKIKDLFPPAELSDALWAKILDECEGEANLHAIGFVCQNEPTTDPRLFERIRSFRDRFPDRVMTFMVTNGTNLDPPTVETLLASGLDAMHVSVNGYGKEDFEAVNEGKSWDRFQANLRHLFAQDLSDLAVMVSFVRNRAYQKEFEKAVAAWRARGIKVFVHGINNRGGLVDDYEEKWAIPLESESWGKRMQKRFMKWFLGCCPYPFIQMSVLADGQCIVCTHDWSRHTVVGNLNEQTIREVWNGPEMCKARMNLLEGRAKDNGACSDCDVFENATFAE